VSRTRHISRSSNLGAAFRTTAADFEEVRAAISSNGTGGVAVDEQALAGQWPAAVLSWHREGVSGGGGL